MSEKEKNRFQPLILTLILVVAVFGVLQTASVIVQGIDTSELAEPLVPIVEGAKYILLSIPVVLAIGFGRNLTGYLMNAIRAQLKDEPAPGYNISRLSKTLIQFEGWVLTVTPFMQLFIEALPQEERMIAMYVSAGVLAVIDMTLSELKRIMAELNPKPG